MKQIKKLCMKMFLVVEMIAFGHVYFSGNNGIKALQHQRVVVANAQTTIAQLADEVAQLECEIYAWQTDDFYKEKVAREQLQMARKGDELFYVGA